MNEPTGTGQISNPEGDRQFGAALLAGLLVALIVAGSAYFLMRGSSSGGPGNLAVLPMGPDEQAYASQIHFTNLEMGRAANFLKQEITTIAGVVRNDGPRNIVEMEVTLEFYDLSSKVVLRQKLRFYGVKEDPLAPNGKRGFQYSFEDIPNTWNQGAPGFNITGLHLQ
jgi:hypothetical protein